jgi:hypothetical protein
MTEPLPDDAILAMSIQAELFIRAGGRLTWAEWKALDAEWRAAFADAGDRVADSRAVSAGWASQGPDQAAQVAEPHDGGALRLRLALSRVADAAEKIAREEP